MRSLMSSFGLLAIVSLATGCDFWGGGKNRYYTYCDATGCYTCTDNGCAPTGGRVGGKCGTSRDCAEGCYCNAATGTCSEAGFCDKQADCANGYTCNLARHSCEPQSPGGGVPDGGVGQGADASRPPLVCKVDADCPGGDYCQNGVCVTSFKCSKDADCGANMKCDARNTCVPGPAACAKDADCAQGAVCVSGVCKTTGLCATDADCAKISPGLVCDGTRSTCVPSPNGGSPCKADCDCGPGKVCNNGVCAVSTPNPNTGCVFNYECGTGQCVNNRCQAKCANDMQCGTGDICQAGFCVANPKPVGGCTYNVDCGPNKTCINAACHINCKIDADCTNPHDFCDSNICKPDWRRVPQCKDNGGCAMAQECVNAVCRTHCWANADCGSCVNQPVCQMGYCVAQVEVNPQCKLQKDCPNGQSCVNATCAK